MNRSDITKIYGIEEDYNFDNISEFMKDKEISNISFYEVIYNNQNIFTLFVSTIYLLIKHWR